MGTHQPLANSIAMPNLKHHLNSGFTLVEMAMVLMIIGLLLGGLVPTISSQMEQQRLIETRKQLEGIQQALIGYAIINDRLPCPAIATSNGVENFASGGSSTNGDCSDFYDGFVPAATLGISGGDSTGRVLDSWGNPIRYAVTKWSPSGNPFVFTKTGGMSATGISGLNSGSFTYLLVCSSANGIVTSPPSCGSTGSISLTPAPGVPALIFSTGGNGQNGNSADELANLADDRVFISHEPMQDGFDDIMLWLSPNTLVNRLVAAGKLP